MLRVLCFAMLCFYLFCVASLCSALLCFAQLCSLCSVLLFPFCPSCWPGERKPRIQLCVFCRQCLIVRWWTTNPVWKKKHIAEFLASPPPKNSANPGLNSANSGTNSANLAESSRNSANVGWIPGPWLNSELLPNSEEVRNSAKVRLEFSQPWLSYQTLAQFWFGPMLNSKTLAEYLSGGMLNSKTLAELAGNIVWIIFALSVFLLLSCLKYYVVFDCLILSL